MDARLWGNLTVDERRVATPSGDIAVTLLGEGPALVLLHGISSRGTSWLSVAAQLADAYRLVIIDQRGHGGSSKPESGYLIGDYADDLEAVLDALKIERPLIAGHSLGGMATLEWARRFPDRAAAIVIEDSPMRRGGEGVAELFDGWIEVASMPIEAAIAHYAAKYPEQDDEARRQRAENITSVAPGVFTELKADMLSQGGAVIIDSYAAVESPVLLIYGDPEFGGMVPQQDADHFRRVVAKSELGFVANGPHSIHHELPERFLEFAQPFLREHAGKATRLSDERGQGQRGLRANGLR